MIDHDSIVNLRDTLYHRQGGKCAVCGAQLEWSGFHCAHRIPQRKHWLKKYGAAIIHHPDNFRATCPTDRCNNAVSIGNNPKAADEIMREIIS
jgi:predicted amidophosphoribosyltransferase